MTRPRTHQANGATVLSEVEARTFLGSAVPLVPSALVADEAALDDAVAAMGEPVVLKGAAPWLVHKSDLGLVRSDIAHGKVAEAYRDLVARGKQFGDLDGVLVQPRLSGHELLIGYRRDLTLGPFVVIGLGGVSVEALDDVAVVPAEATPTTIRSAIRGLRGAATLIGGRGAPRADLDAVARIVRRVGRFGYGHPEVAELDLNPVIVGTDFAVAADARVVLRQPTLEPRSGHHDLRPLFDPESIAIVGASTNPTKLGARALRYLVGGGFDGSVTVVHPTETRLNGVPATPSIASISPAPDLVSVVVGSDRVTGVLDECIRAGVRSAVVHSGEFGRVGSESRTATAIVRRANDAGMVILGPNSMGVMSPQTGVFASFAGVLEAGPIPPGSIGLVSQSGAIGSTLLSRAADDGFGFSRWISTGNELDVDIADVLAFYADDPKTSVVLAYVETIRRGAAFRRSAERLREGGKPLLVYLGGRSAAGRDVVASHTGRLATSPRLAAAFLDDVGAVRAPTLASLLMAGMTLERQGSPAGDRTAIVTMSGAAAGICADAADAVGLNVARLRRSTTDALRRIIPPSGRVRSPIDVTAHAMTDPSILIQSIDLLIADPGVDQIVIQLTTNADPVAETIAQAIARRIADPGTKRTTMIVSRLGSPRLAPRAMDAFAADRIPVLTWPEDAIRTAAVTGQVGRHHLIRPGDERPTWTSA